MFSAGRGRPVRRCWRRSVLLACCLPLLLYACASYHPPKSAGGPAADSLHTQTHNDVTVATALLSDDAARRLYGVDLAGVGLQAIWISIDNRSDHSHWLLVSALDPDYFAPGEAAALFYASYDAAGETALNRQFHRLALPLKSSAGSVSEGYVLAPRHEGGRYLGVTLAGAGHALKYDFAVSLPDGSFDFESLRPSQIYAGQERPELDFDELRSIVRKLPCCAGDESAEREGDPLNLVLLGNADDVLAALSRAGWSFTHRIDLDSIRRLVGAWISGAAYPVAPVSPLYLYGRQQDIALQRARNTIFQRNHIRLWLAPFRVQGKSVWVGQVSRDVGVKLTLSSPHLTTHVIDANVDEAREHLLQSLMVSGVLRRFGFVSGMPASYASAPRSNLSSDPYYTDGLRLVAQLQGAAAKIPVEAVQFLPWRKSPDPLVDASPD